MLSVTQQIILAINVINTGFGVSICDLHHLQCIQIQGYDALLTGP